MACVSKVVVVYPELGVFRVYWCVNSVIGVSEVFLGVSRVFFVCV